MGSRQAQTTTKTRQPLKEIQGAQIFLRPNFGAMAQQFGVQTKGVSVLEIHNDLEKQEQRMDGMKEHPSDPVTNAIMVVDNQGEIQTQLSIPCKKSASKLVLYISDKFDNIMVSLMLRTSWNCDFPMRVISWNCWGIGSQNFFRNIKELINIINPNVLIGMETRVTSSRAKRIASAGNYDGLVASEAKGYAGGSSVSGRHVILTLKWLL